MLANCQLLSEAEAGRVSRTCARIAVSCVLYFRKALPIEAFYPGAVNGVSVPLLNRADRTGSFIVDLLEVGVMPAVKEEKVSGVKVCIYCDGVLSESYDVALAPHSGPLEKTKVPSLIQALKSDIISAASTLTPLPTSQSIAVGLKVAYCKAAPASYALPGFNMIQDAFSDDEQLSIVVSHQETGCEVKVSF